MLTWRKILVATDFSEPARRALRSAEGLIVESGGELCLIHVIELPPAIYPAGFGGLSRAVEQSWVDAAKEDLHREGGEARERGARVEELLKIGRPWVEIVQAAEAAEVDAICIGNAGHSLVERLVMGSTAENVVRHSPVPVLLVHERALSRVDRVLIPWHFDEGSRMTIRYALDRFPERTELIAYHVVAPLPPGDPVVGPLVPDLAAIREEMRAWLDEAGAGRVSEEVRLMADPAAAILEAARERDVDLVLMTTHGRVGIARVLLGSVAEKVVRHADRPVLVLPGPGGRNASAEPVGEEVT
jgi:nucleotide-binding universal stress UspA family protein